MDCIICLCPIGSEPIQCSEVTCTEHICGECLDAYIQAQLDTGNMPRCVSTKCSGIYLYSVVQSKGTSEAADNYRRLCAKYYTNAHSGELQRTYEKDRIITRLRAERHEFIQRSFPRSVEIVAGIVFPHKLKRVTAFKIAKISRDVRQATRTCMRLFCNGHLTDELLCLSCDTQYCYWCEEVMVTADHVCNADTVESVQQINTMVRCPECQLPVERAYGCNNMTCANDRCNTKFNYATGEKITNGHGGHSIAITVATTYKLSLAMQDLPDLQQQMVHLESFHKQTPVSDRPILKWVGKLKELQATTPVVSNTAAAAAAAAADAAADETELAFRQHKLCRAVEKYYRALTIHRFIARAMAEVEQMFRQNILTPDHIKSVIRQIEIL
jgi:hypothetical protein